MAQLELAGAVKKRALRRAQSRWVSKAARERRLTELLSEDIKARARVHFSRELAPPSHDLMLVYNEAISYLLEELVVVEDEQRNYHIVPRRIMQPSEADSGYSDFYLSLFAFGRSYSAYNSVLNEVESDRRRVLARKATSKEKKEGIDREWHALNRRRTNNPGEKTQIESRKKELEALSGDQQRIIDRHQNALDRLDNRLQEHLASNPVGAYYRTLLSKAQQLGLERLLKVDVPDADGGVSVDSPESLREKVSSGVSIQFNYYTKPVHVSKNYPLKLLGTFAFIAGVISLWVVYGPTMVRKAFRLKPKSCGKTISYNPNTHELTAILPGETEPATTKLNVANLYIPTRQYVPGPVAVQSFNPEAKEVTLRYLGGVAPEFSKTWILEYLEPEHWRDTKPDVQLLHYELRDGKLYAIARLFSLHEDGRAGLINFEGLPESFETEVPDEDIAKLAKSLAETYESIDTVHLDADPDVDMSIRGVPVRSVRYNHRRGQLIFATSQADYALHLGPAGTSMPPNLSSPALDNIPDALVISEGIDPKKQVPKDWYHYFDLVDGKARLLIPPRITRKVGGPRDHSPTEIIVHYFPRGGVIPALPGGKLDPGANPNLLKLEPPNPAHEVPAYRPPSPEGSPQHGHR